MYKLFMVFVPRGFRSEHTPILTAIAVGVLSITWALVARG